MKHQLSFLIIFFQTLLAHDLSASLHDDDGGWKAGVASVAITPEQSLWMAGYADRDHPSEGKLHDLWAKALVIEDAKGKQAVLISTDLSGIPKSVSDTIRNRLERQFNLSRSQIIINTSHTHSGPVLNDALLALYPLDSQQLERIKSYTIKFEGQIESIVREALRSMKPVNLYAQNGITRFQVNRRNNIESKLNPQTNLNGPNDYSVPVIKVLNKKGELMAVAFGYACHNTVLNGYKWSGDYAGFAQIQLEKLHPGVTALFFQGCGGNQNPLPRRTVALAQQYGHELVAAVEGVLDGNMRELDPRLTTAYSEVDIEFTSPPSIEELSKMASSSSGYQKNWAVEMIKKMERGESYLTSYPYPLQVWQLGDQSIVSLGGEPVVEYAIKLKQLLNQDIFVLGYSNDVMAYIPTVAILREGGYEGATSQMAFGLPGPWKETIETTIIQEVMNLAKQVGVVIPSTN